jgi:hypothetical protein
MINYSFDKNISKNAQQILETIPNSYAYTIGFIFGINFKQTPDKLLKNVPIRTNNLTSYL